MTLRLPLLKASIGRGTDSLRRARANQSVLCPYLPRWPPSPVRHQPRALVGDTDRDQTPPMRRVHLPSPVDRSSLEGLQHGFDSGCNSRVWAGRGKKKSIAHRWMFYSNPSSPQRERASYYRTTDRGHGEDTSQTPAIHPRLHRNNGPLPPARGEEKGNRVANNSLPSSNKGKPGNRRCKMGPNRPNSAFSR